MSQPNMQSRQMPRWMLQRQATAGAANQFVQILVSQTEIVKTWTPANIIDYATKVAIEMDKWNEEFMDAPAPMIEKPVKSLVL